MYFPSGDHAAVQTHLVGYLTSTVPAAGPWGCGVVPVVVGVVLPVVVVLPVRGEEPAGAPEPPVWPGVFGSVIHAAIPMPVPTTPIPASPSTTLRRDIPRLSCS